MPYIIDIDNAWELEVIQGLSDEEQVKFFILLDKITANSLSIAHSSHDKENEYIREPEH